MLIVEVGGTVGDIESLPFLEAIRQIALENGPQNCLFLHVTLVPFLSTTGEVKTKPTQHSVKELREIGIQPDILLCRTEHHLEDKVREKIALFCNVSKDDVFEVTDVETVYELPLVLEAEKLGERVLQAPGHARQGTGSDRVEGPRRAASSTRTRPCASASAASTWRCAIPTSRSSKPSSTPAPSTTRGWNCTGSKPKISKAAPPSELLAGCSGVLVPGGFGERGFEGKVTAAHYARVNKLPYFGLCLGLQIAVDRVRAQRLRPEEGQHARSSSPMQTHCVIDFMPEQRGIRHKGATMRLGSYPCFLTRGSRAHQAFGTDAITERHRHRFEVNNGYPRSSSKTAACKVTRRLARRQSCGDHRTRKSSLVPRGAVPSRTEKPPDATASAVPRFRRRLP